MTGVQPGTRLDEFPIQLFGLGVFPRKQQATHFRGLIGQFVLRWGLNRSAGPKADFVQADSLPRNAAVDHRSQPPVADGQGVLPPVRRPAVPQRQRAGRSLSLTREGVSGVPFLRFRGISEGQADYHGSNRGEIAFQDSHTFCFHRTSGLASV